MITLQSLFFGLVYLMLDALWLSVMTPTFYRPQFEAIQNQPLRFKTAYAVVAYAILLATLFLICVPLSRVYTRLHTSVVFAMVGLSVYGVYNMTNAAVLEEYTLKTCIVDTLWGTLSFAIMGSLSRLMF
jgi:uncharacterized membrane protein